MLQAPKKKPLSSAVATLTESRNPALQIPRKGLGRFVLDLVDSGFLSKTTSAKAKGGSQKTVELKKKALALSDEELRGLLAQTGVGFPLAELRPLEEVLENLATGSAEKRGWFGEMLAIHVCFMLGLRVIAWRRRAPHAEIDLIAERTAGLTYQRWAIQVKNTSGPLDADRVDREVGAVAATGVTHILFFVPRGELTQPALGEIYTKSRLSNLHIYFLSSETIGEQPNVEVILRELDRQARDLAALKTEEAERRER